MMIIFYASQTGSTRARDGVGVGDLPHPKHKEDFKITVGRYCM